MAHTFESLSQMSRDELEQVLLTGEEPPLGDEIVGWEFEGWNVNPTARLIGSRKFKKGLFGHPDMYGDPVRPHAWGYNMTVQQNDFTEPWIATPTPANPTRRFFYGVVPGAQATKPKYPNTLVIDYRLWDYFALNPIGYTVDYLVYPNPGDPELVLGKSYMESPLLKPFLGFFILRRDRQRSSYARRSHFLSDRQLDTVKAFAEVFLPDTAAIGPEDVTANIDLQLERIKSKRTRSLGLVFFAIEHVLPLTVLGPAFSRMSKDARRRLIERQLQRATGRLLRNLAKIKALFAAGYYADPRVYQSIGFTPVTQRTRYDDVTFSPNAQPAVNVIRNPRDVEHCDVCVIGSGAAGAVAAANFAAQGQHVIVLEEGRHFASGDMSHDEGKMVAATYKEGGLQTTVDLDMVLLQGRSLGGTTVVNNAICFDLRHDVIDEWNGLGANLDEAKLAQSFRDVRREIGAADFPAYADTRVPDIGGNNPKRLLDGWNARGGGNAASREHGYFNKNVKECLGCGYCNFGCPYGRKLSMLETFLPKLAPPSGAITGCHAVGIERNGRKATAVRAELVDGREIRIVAAKAIVLACGAIGSSVLLMKNKIRVRSRGRDLVGSRFSFNAGTPMFALFEQPVTAFDAMQMGAYVGCTDGTTTGDYLLESHFDPPMTFAASLPGWFEVHFERMKRYPHFASAGVLIRTEPNARVKTTGLFRDLTGPVEWKIAPADLEKLLSGMAHVAWMWFGAGAQTVLPATFKDVELKRAAFGNASPQDIADELRTSVTRKGDLTLSSAHLQGGNPLSDDSRLGVVDSNFRVKGFDNLFVCDASVFPSSVGVNPQLTVMAMADYFSRLGVV